MRARHAEQLVGADARALRPRVMRAVAAALLSAATASCANLGALECQGGSCSDASTDAAAGGGDGGAPGIVCGAGVACTPGSQECCLAGSGQTSCVPAGMCNGGTDILCDDPRQCPAGGTCWICITATQGFQGTSCDYQGDIVGVYHCDMTTAHPLCHSSSQCAAGQTCTPLPVDSLDAGADAGPWFSVCQ